MAQIKKNGAIIGYGGMGSWHGSYLKNSDVVNLKGIYDIKPERASLAEANGIHAYSSLKELLEDKEIDFVTIAVPNDLHKPIAIQAMEAGKHVICEKPVTLNSDDLREMIDASKKYDRLFTVHQNRRWDADFLAMRDLYRSGDLGQVYHIESRVHGSRGIPGDWRQLPECGGGMMLDWGIHLVDQIMLIVHDKALKRIWCRFDHITNELVDDGFYLEMYFEGDLTAHVEVGTSHFIPMPRYYMTGANGSGIVRGWEGPCEVVWCHNWENKDAVPVITAAGLTKTMAPRDEKTIASKEIPLPQSDVHDFYRNFVKAIDGLEPQIVNHHQMTVDMAIMEAAFLSHKTGLPVDVDLKF